MQAIITKYLGPTNTRGSRIKASCDRGSITIPYPHIGIEEDHVAAAQALVDKFVKEDAAQYGEHENPWSRPRACGSIPSGEYVHVFTYKTAKTIKPYSVKYKGYEITVPSGSTVSNQTAMGPDDSYRFWIGWRKQIAELTGFENSMLAHDLKHYGLNVPAEFCEPYKPC